MTASRQLKLARRALCHLTVLLTAALCSATSASAAIQPGAPVALSPPGTAPTGAVLVSNPSGALAFVAPENRTVYRTKAVRLTTVSSAGQVVLQRRFALAERQLAYDLTAAVGPDGAVTAAWTQSDLAVPGRTTAPARVRAVRCTTDGCGPVRTLGRSRFLPHPAVALDGHGRAVVLWRGNRGTTPRFLWRRSHGNDYSQPRGLDGVGLNPVMLSLPDGGVFAAWEKGGLPTRTTATLPDGAQRFRVGSGSYSGIPQLALAGDRVVLVTSVRNTSRDGTFLGGPVTARLGMALRGEVAFSAPQVVNSLPAMFATVAGGRSGRAAIAFAASPDSNTNVLQPQAVLLEPGGSAFESPVGLVATSDSQVPFGPFTPAVGSDGTVRVLLDGRLTTASQGPCCSFDTPLLSTLTPGEQPVTAPVPGSQPPPRYDGVYAVQSGLVAGDALALRARDGSWSVQLFKQGS